MDSNSYLALNAWLQKSDGNYIEGRLLWLNSLVNGACNLLWLALEQIIKIILLQKQINEISSDVSNLDELHNKLDKKGKKLGHNVHALIQSINTEYPDLDISKYEKTLNKLQEFFYRRYVVHSGNSISLLTLNAVDELYFLLRSKVSSDVGLGTIDEIYIQKKHKWTHPIPAFAYSYLQNIHFQPRKHREINLIGPDGKEYKESGI
jgi:hypothetical protein